MYLHIPAHIRLWFWSFVNPPLLILLFSKWRIFYFTINQSYMEQQVENKVEVKELNSDSFKEILNDPKLTEHANYWFQFLRKKFGKRSFTVRDVIKQTKTTQENVSNIITVLCMKNMCVGRNYGTVESFKLTETIQAKIFELEQEKEYHERLLQSINSNLEVLKEQLIKEEVSSN